MAGRRKKEGRNVGLKEGRKMKREGGKGKERKKSYLLKSQRKVEKEN